MSPAAQHHGFALTCRWAYSLLSVVVVDELVLLVVLPLVVVAPPVVVVTAGPTSVTLGIMGKWLWNLCS